MVHMVRVIHTKDHVRSPSRIDTVVERDTSTEYADDGVDPAPKNNGRVKHEIRNRARSSECGQW